MRPTAPSTSAAATALTWLSLKSATDAIFGISFSRGVVNFLAPTATKTAASSEAMIHRVTFMGSDLWCSTCPSGQVGW